MSKKFHSENIFIQENAFEYVVWEMAAILSQPQCVNGSHLAREPTASPVLTKWWNWELTLAINFGSHAQMVAKFGGQIMATKFGFVPDWLFYLFEPISFNWMQQVFIMSWQLYICLS